AGSTAFDSNVQALLALLTEWSRTDEGYGQKVANLEGTPVGNFTPSGGMNGSFFLNPQTVQSSGTKAHLKGGPATDWYFANLAGTGRNGKRDNIDGLQLGEMVTNLPV